MIQYARPLVLGRRLGVSLIGLAACLAAPGTALAQGEGGAEPQEAGTATQAEVGLQDIIVTAQRREQNLQNVPVAVTALSTDALDQARVTNIERLSGFAPNLLVAAQAVPGTPVLTIRGINSGPTDVGVDPKVAVYLDGVYFGRASGTIFDLADIERVEVLRGPQGTLFGRNATAGAISVVTSPPSGEFGVKQLLSYGNFDAFRSRTVLNLPAVGPLSVKLAFLHNEIEGDVRNLIGGKTVDPRGRDARFGPFTYADRLGGSNVNAFQGKARLDLGDLLVDYSYDITDTKAVSRAGQVLSPITSNAAGGLAAAILGFQGLTGGITNLTTTPQTALASSSSVGHTTVQGHALTFTYNPTSDLVIKNIASLRYLNERPFLYDITASGGLRFSAAQLGALLVGDVAGVTNPANQPGPNDRFQTIFVGETIRQHQFSNELQLNYTGDALDLTAGLFFFREKGSRSNIVDIFEAIPNGVNTPSPFDAIFGSGVPTAHALNKSYAGYVQATVHVTPQLDLIGGIRGTIDKRRVSREFAASAAVVPTQLGTFDATFRRVNFTGIVNYRPSDNLTAYAKIATGYVAGGVFGGLEFRPETLTSYEIGLKSQLFDNRLRANIAAFYMDYKDLQVPDNVNGITFYSNAGKAKIPGVEIELTAAPVEGLNLTANLGYQDFKYKQYIQTIGGVPTDIADISRPLYTSKVTLQLGAQYDFAEFDGGARPYVRIDGRYRSKSYISPTVLTGGNPAETAKLRDLSTVRPYWLVDGRAGITKIPLGAVTASVSAYVQNLFDVRRFDGGAPVIVLQGVYNRPRTYGVEISAEF